MNNLPKSFDLLKVEYKHGSGCCLAYAPTGKVSADDYVETTLGVGRVVTRSIYHTPDESLIRVLDGTVSIDKVLWKLVPIKYEEADDAEHPGCAVDD